MYNLPVTLRTRIPTAWIPTAKVAVNGQRIPSQAERVGQDALVRYSIILSARTVVISATPMQPSKPADGTLPQPNTHP